MVTLDYIVIAIILISAIAGLVRGFLREIISFVSWVLAVWLAWKIAPSLAPHLGGVLREPPFGLWASRALVFIGVLVAGAIIGAVVDHFVRLSIFSGLDRLLGFVLGLLRGLVIVGVAIILAQAARLDGEDWWKQSRIVQHMEPLANLLRSLAGDRLPARAVQDG